jgi:hypothetical protein
MHIWTDLLTREAALLVILTALGAAPAAFLSERFDGASRLALAPILGFCLGTCIAVTMLEVAPTSDTYWIFVPVALLSLAVAGQRSLRTQWVWRDRLPLRDFLQLFVVCIVITGPLTYTLHEHHTVGPAAYTYTDVDNYVAEEDGAQTTSIADATHAWERSLQTGRTFADLTQQEWAFFAHFSDKLDSVPLDANVDAMLGLGATETNSSFLIVLLLAGALAAFTTVRYVTGSHTWMAVLAGSLFGGPMFIELWFDTFQAAIVGLSLVMPFAMLSSEALRSRRTANLLLLALVAGTLLTAYPLYIPAFAVAGVVVLASLAPVIRRRGGGLRPSISPLALRIFALVILTITFDFVAFTRNIHYYKELLENMVPLPRVDWHLPLEVLPGWLLQTREFWYMPSLSTGEVKQIVLGAALPLVFLAVIFIGLRRYRYARALVVLACVFAVVAEYAYVSNNACTYCAERDLLPIGPIAAVLLAVGLAVLLAATKRGARVLGVAGLTLVVVAVGQRTRVELRRFSDGAYFLDSANRSVLSKLPTNASAVQIEGYGETLSAQAEQPLVYHLVDEHLPGRVSIVLGSDLNNAIEYLDFGVLKTPALEFHADYDYVLTRFAGIKTARETVARSGGIALERRTQSLDIITYSGLEAPVERLDTSGTAWVQPSQPLKMYVVGMSAGPVWAKLTLRVSVPVSVPPQAGVRELLANNTLTVCVLTTGSRPVRSASVQFSAPPVPGPAPLEEFPPAVPLEGIALTSMHASSGHCSV